jgi:phospholipid/cholesterol/gamma-HCH transport system substrate-binding protein
VLAFTILYVGGGGGSPLAPKYEVKALMTDVNGLKPGAPVRVGGLEVGTVTGVDFAPEGTGMVEVSMRLDRRVKARITTESRATLGSLGLLGEKAVDITGSPRGAAVEDGGYLPAAGEDPIKGLLTDASDSTAHLRRILSRMDAGGGLVGKALRDEELYERMVDVSVRLQGAMKKLESESGPLGRLINDRDMSRRLSDTVRGMETVVSRVEAGSGAAGMLTRDEELGRDLKSLTARLNEVMGRLQKGEGTLGRMLLDDALYRKIDSVSTRLDGLLAHLEKGEGTAGKIFQDPQLYDSLAGALKELKGLVSDVRRDPRKYLRVKVSLF